MAEADSTIPNKQNPWNKLDDVMVETVLARLPTVDIFRCQFVCKRWKSIIHCSPSFSITSKQLFNRRPWFFMFNSIRSSSISVVYDMEASDWQYVHLRIPTHPTPRNPPMICPVASSGGLICFDRTFGTDYYTCIVNNPLTGVSRSIPNVKTYGDVRGITMRASKSGYNIFIVYGNWPFIVMKVFSWSPSSQDHQEAKWKLLRMRNITMPHAIYDPTDCTPIEEMAGVTTLGNEGQILVHYLVKGYPSRGRLICFDTLKGTYFISPRLLHNFAIVDMVECGGRVFTIVLDDGYEVDYPSLLVWEFDHERVADCWKHIAEKPLNWWKPFPGVMPLNIVKDYHGLKTNMNCSGHGDYIMVCLNFDTLIAIGHFNHVIMYNIKENTWSELPPCLEPDDPRRVWFGPPFSFEPEIGAKV